MNGTRISSCSSDPTAEKIAKSSAYCLILIVSLVGNTFIGIIVCKTKAMRKTTNFLIVNMAMSDLLFPIFAFQRELSALFVDSWLISGPLGQDLCKLYVFFSDASTAVCSEPGSDSSGSIWCCGVSPPFSTHQFKAVPVVHPCDMDRRDGYPVHISLYLQSG